LGADNLLLWDLQRYRTPLAQHSASASGCCCCCCCWNRHLQFSHSRVNLPLDLTQPDSGSHWRRFYLDSGTIAQCKQRRQQSP